MVDERITAHKDFKKLLHSVRFQFINRGLRPPSTREMTEIVARKIKKEDILFSRKFRFR